MAVDGNLADDQGHLLRSAPLSHYVTRPLSDGNTSAQVRQSEGIDTVTPIGSAEKIKQSSVLRNRQQLALTELPAGRSEVVRYGPDLTYKGLCHKILVSVPRGKYPLHRDTVIQYQIRHQIGVRLIAPCSADRLRRHLRRTCHRRPILRGYPGAIRRPNVSAWAGLISHVICTICRMVMSGHLGHKQSHRFNASLGTKRVVRQSGTLAGGDCQPPAQIG